MTDPPPNIDQLARQILEFGPPADLGAALDAACEGDPRLRAAIEQRVQELAAAYPTIEPEASTAPGLPPALAATSLGFLKGDRVGHFRLIEILGQGGFGVVWRAEQTEPVRREVALKLIKPGMDSQQVLARFEAERQALAVMDHPCIAKVFDGGATDRGVPYFVMELVKGEPITEFCDRHKLSIAERVGLFIDVCEAVQHAHMKGVIHRDLKPGNILVTYDADGKPQPKVIDFGIAKALSQRLTEQTIFTEHGQMIGTPEYMSPEQAEMSGLDIDTRSDVYSLGVLLYELLTGALPFDPKTLRAAGFAEIQRIIREVDPPKPSTKLSTALGADESTRERIIAARAVDLRELTMTLKRDLDWVVMRCLEKERSRRYDTASDIADELRRYLNHEPVRAGPPSAAYRLRKFVRRNRAGVIAGSMVAAALVLAVVGTTWGMVWAITERDRAEHAETAAEDRAEELELVAEFQSSQLSEVDAEGMGAGIRDRLVGQVADTMRLGGVGGLEVESSISTLRELLGQANFTTLSLDALDEQVFERALAAIERDFADKPLLQARLLQTMASTLRAVGLGRRALEPQRQALALRRAELGDLHPDTLYSIGRTGALLVVIDLTDQARPLLLEAYEGMRQVLGPDDPQTLGALNNRAAVLQQGGRNEEALEVLKEVLASQRRVVGDDALQTLRTLINITFAYEDLGRFEEAELHMREAYDRAARTLGDDHPYTIDARAMLGMLLKNLGEYGEAEVHQVAALEQSRRVLGDDHANTLNSVHNLGELRRAQGRLAEAEQCLREVWGRRHRLGGGENGRQAMSALDTLTKVLIEQGKFYEAEPLCLESQRVSQTPRSLARLVELYARWAEAEPDAGHVAHADRWRAQLPTGEPSDD